MTSGNQIKVALVRPPLEGHLHRGTGIYTQCLLEQLKHDKSIIVRRVVLPDNLSGFDLVHFPYFDPFFLTLPIFRSYKTVVTVHDLIPLKYPKFFPKGIRGFLKWQLQKLSLHKSRAIITDSEASKKDIIRLAGIDRDKIYVIPLGVGMEFKKITSSARLRQIQAELNLPDKFILNVGDVNYNKNITGLIKAFNLLSRRVSDLNLVLVGQGFTGISSQLSDMESLIRKYNIGKQIIRLSNLTADQLVGIYNLAKIYIQPSFAEGFGLPVLEAMKCGCPVVSSDRSSLPEITGEAAISVDPNNTDKIADETEKLLNNDKLRKTQISKGYQQANKFSWQKCARETVGVYREILNISY